MSLHGNALPIGQALNPYTIPVPEILLHPGTTLMLISSRYGNVTNLKVTIKRKRIFYVRGFGLTESGEPTLELCDAKNALAYELDINHLPLPPY